MKRTIAILLLSGSLFGVGCSRPTAEAPVPATPSSQESKPEDQKEQTVKAESVKVHTMKAEPMNDKPITGVSPSASASTTPKP